MQAGAQGAVARSIPGADVPGQPRQPPRFSAQPRHLPAFNLDGHGVSLQPALDTLLQAFRAGIVGSRPLGAAGHLPAVSQNPSDTVHIYPYAFTGAGGMYVPSGNLNLAGSFYLDGSSLLLVGSATFDGLSLSLASVTSAGMTGLYVTASFAAGEHLLSTAIQLQVSPNTTRVGGTFLDADLPAGTFWAAGVMVGLTAMRQVTDLGYYRGDDVARLSQLRGIDAQAQGLRRTELVHLRGQSLALRGGGGSFKIAALGRLEFARSQQTTLRLLGSCDAARDLLFEESGPRHWARNKRRALGMRQDRLPLPALNAPSELAIGDEIVQLNSRSVSPSVIVGNLAVFFGVQAFIRRDYELGVHRLDEHHVEVTLNPTRIANYGVFVASPFGPELDVGRDQAQSMRQCFRFDMRIPQAQAALTRMRQQSLPQSLAAPAVDARTWRRPMDMAAQFVAHDAALPEGVERRWWHAVGTTEWRYGLGVDWRLVPYWLTPKGWVMAFGVHKSRIRERQLVTTAESTHLADTRTQTLAQDRLFAGRFVTSATAQLRFAPDAANAPCLDGLTVRAEWRLAGARKRAVQARMLVPMRRRFGLPLPDAAPAQCRQDRSVCLEQEIDPTELGLGQTHPSRHVQWHMAAQQSRLSTGAAAQLLQKLDAIDRTAAESAQAQGDAPNRRAKAVARFVAHEGLGGCAFIYRNACGPRPLQLTSHSSSTDSAIKNADGLALKYPQALQPKTPPAAAFARLRQAIGIQGELVAAAKDVQGDPFLRHDDRAILQERLRDAQTKLAGVTAMSDATMQALAQGVHKARKSAARLFWRRGQTRLKKAIDGLLTPLAPLREQVQALEAQYGQQRMPDTYGPLWARAQAIWATQARLLAYKAWLEAADGPLAPQLRAMQARQVEALLARLGNSAGTTGLWAPASLPPSVRLQILSQARLSSLRRQVNEQHRRLIRDLDRPGGPCPL